MKVKVREIMGLEKIIVLSPNVVVHQGMITTNVFIHGEYAIHFVNLLDGNQRVSFAEVVFKKCYRRTMNWFFKKYKSGSWSPEIEKEWRKIIAKKEAKK